MRAAARELIAATRSFLDAAEALLDDPASTARVMVVVSALAQQVQRLVGDVVTGQDGAAAPSGGPDAGT